MKELPVGKNFRNLTKLSEIFSRGFFSGGNFPRGAFRNLLKSNMCLQPLICTFKVCVTFINSEVTSCPRDTKILKKVSGSFRKHRGQPLYKVYKQLFTADKL